ncbi:unnamed protein product [Diabrotica balteata]|uniref:Uncharacterized protein n=1 Tax=Diabrotica balteata TaxID=107213 RepID=A0A9N9SNF3_DIABA|nr:unnamed protein product [Diabrotica balteata]
MPSIVFRQTCRQNQPANCCEEYFRKSIYLSLFDNILTDLEDLLSLIFKNIFNLRVILPKTDNTPEDKVALKKIVDTFQYIIGPSTADSTVE